MALSSKLMKKEHAWEVLGYLTVIALVLGFGYAPEKTLPWLGLAAGVFVPCAFLTVYGLCLVPWAWNCLCQAFLNWPQTYAGLAFFALIVGSMLVSLGETQDAILWGWLSIVIGAAFAANSVSGYCDRRGAR